MPEEDEGVFRYIIWIYSIHSLIPNENCPEALGSIPIVSLSTIRGVFGTSFRKGAIFKSVYRNFKINQLKLSKC